MTRNLSVLLKMVKWLRLTLGMTEHEECLEWSQIGFKLLIDIGFWSGLAFEFLIIGHFKKRMKDKRVL